jgi:hypothetical protein
MMHQQIVSQLQLQLEASRLKNAIQALKAENQGLKAEKQRLQHSIAQAQGHLSELAQALSAAWHVPTQQPPAH